MAMILFEGLIFAIGTGFSGLPNGTEGLILARVAKSCSISDVDSGVDSSEKRLSSASLSNSSVSEKKICKVSSSLFILATQLF